METKLVITIDLKKSGCGYFAIMDILSSVGKSLSSAHLNDDFEDERIMSNDIFSKNGKLIGEWEIVEE